MKIQLKKKTESAAKLQRTGNKKQSNQCWYMHTPQTVSPEITKKIYRKASTD
jgi:hypothetical protein